MKQNAMLVSSVFCLIAAMLLFFRSGNASKGDGDKEFTTPHPLSLITEAPPKRTSARLQAPTPKQKYKKPTVIPRPGTQEELDLILANDEFGKARETAFQKVREWESTNAEPLAAANALSLYASDETYYTRVPPLDEESAAHRAQESLDKQSEKIPGKPELINYALRSEIERYTGFTGVFQVINLNLANGDMKSDSLTIRYLWNRDEIFLDAATGHVAMRSDYIPGRPLVPGWTGDVDSSHPKWKRYEHLFNVEEDPQD